MHNFAKCAWKLPFCIQICVIYYRSKHLRYFRKNNTRPYIINSLFAGLQNVTIYSLEWMPVPVASSSRACIVLHCSNLGIVVSMSYKVIYEIQLLQWQAVGLFSNILSTGWVIVNRIWYNYEHLGSEGKT